MIESTFGDSTTMNNGSIVGLPNSSSDEDDSTESLVRAGDALCRSLIQEQQDQTAAQASPCPPHASNEVDVDSFAASSDGDRQPNLTEIETESTPSPLRSEVNAVTGVHEQQQVSLEDRVQELETKLATLSRMLQKQQRLSVRNLLARSPTGSQRNLNGSQRNLNQPPLAFAPRLHMPLMEDVQMNDDNIPHRLTDSPPSSYVQPRMTQKGMVPYLESPAPMDELSPHQRSLHQRKRLSFCLLYDGNEENVGLADDEHRALAPSHSKPPLTDTVVTATINHDNTPLEHPIRTTPLNDEDGTTMDTTEVPKEESDMHPLQKDATFSPRASIGSNQSVTGANSSSEPPESPGERPSGTNYSLAHVAAVVDAQNNGNAATNTTTSKEASIETSNHSSSMDGSRKPRASSIDGSRKPRTSSMDGSRNQPATPSNTGKATIQKEEQLKTSSPLPSKAGMLTPLILSQDKRSKWLDHLNSFQETNHDVDRQMQEFIKVPGAVEKTLGSGLLICVDSFLNVCTILPIRFAWSCVLLTLHYFFKWTNKPAGNYQFHRRHSYQLIQVGIILFIYRYVLLPISIGKLYHWIRGQAMIKLYVVIAMVEIFDRLMCSLGQDCLDSLYWNTTRRPRSTRMLISVSVVVVYTAVHSLILFVHVATLNVAMNSADEALLALLIGGNFAEIKSTVFKKFNKASLFKIVASDICERFKVALFLGLILLLNFCQGMDSRKLSDYRRIATIVWMSELFCDWLKHAFITKFNFIPSTVYPEYGLLLAGDVTGIGHEGVNLDHSHAVVKRIGFAQMPLVCVTARLVREAAKYMSLRIDSQTVPLWIILLSSAGCWILLLSFKIFLGAYLQRTSLAKLYAAPELSQTPLKAKQKKQ